MKNEDGYFLISAYSLTGNADKKLWDNFIGNMKHYWLFDATQTQVLEF